MKGEKSFLAGGRGGSRSAACGGCSHIHSLHPECRGTHNVLPGNSDITTLPSVPLSHPDLKQCFSDTPYRMPEASSQTAGGKDRPACLPTWKCGASRGKMVLLRGISDQLCG